MICFCSIGFQNFIVMGQLSGTANFHHQISLAFLVTNLNNSFKKSKKN
jgi:hypothetical protein